VRAALEIVEEVQVAGLDLAVPIAVETGEAFASSVDRRNLVTLGP
jgi:hypothetical protein